MDTADLNNRFTYHAPKPEDTQKFVQLRGEVLRVAELLNEICPESREKSLSVTHLEEAVFWAIAAIARKGE